MALNLYYIITLLSCLFYQTILNTTSLELLDIQTILPVALGNKGFVISVNYRRVSWVECTGFGERPRLTITDKLSDSEAQSVFVEIC